MKMRLNRLAKLLLLLALAPAEGVAQVCSFGNAELDVRFDAESGMFDVADKTSGRTWVMLRDSGSTVQVSRVAMASNGVDYVLASSEVTSDVKVELRLVGRELSVRLSSVSSADVSASGISYPGAFESAVGERILLPICCGHSYPVEASYPPDRDYPLWTRNGVKMGCWGQYSETVGEDGTLRPGSSYLAIVETQPFGALVHRRRSNGLRSAGIRWEGARGKWKEDRLLRYVFFAAGGPMQMAKRYRRYADERGYRVPFHEKARRNPRLADGFRKLAGAPNVWYRDMAGDKVEMAHRLKEIGFENFIYSYIQRKDLGCWVEPDEIRRIAEIPGVLQSEYDIFTDLVDPALLDEIDCVRPHWPEDAWARDDIVRERDGSVRYGWRVARKDDPERKPIVGCALLCEAKALPYMRTRIDSRMGEAPGLAARFIDVTGTVVHECHNPLHPLDRAESADARRAMLGMLGDRYGLVAGTESGLECLVPACDYFEGNVSSSACGTGRDMWEVYDEVPEDVAAATDPANRVPFWEMVYHDCVVSYWYWCDYNNKYPCQWRLRDLVNAITGTPPMYLFTRELFDSIREALAASVKVTTPVARATFGVPMSDYRWLSPDRLVQQSVFENGVTVTVNFSEHDFTMADGSTLRAMSHRVEGLPPRLGVEGNGARITLDDGRQVWRTETCPYPARVISASGSRIDLEIETKDGSVAATWSVGKDGALGLRLSAPSDRNMSEPLVYPPAWVVQEGDRGIHPIGEGLAYDVNDADFRPKATGYPFRRAHDVTMGFYGIERGGRYLMQGLADSLFAEYFITDDVPRRAYVRWIPENGTWGRDREIRFFPAESLGAAAGGYRAWRETFGHVRTLAERAAANPRLNLLSGAADFWVWDDNAQNRLYNWPLVKESAPRDVRRIAGEMKARGMDRVLWCGFDDEAPEDCAFLTELGYLVGTYDCFRDVYHKGLLEYTDPRNFARGARFLPFAEDVTCIKEDGAFDTAWTVPDKDGKLHDMYGLCDVCGPELARRLIAPDVGRIGYSARLMDVQIAEGPHPCFSPRHPATLREALEAQRKEHRYLQEELRQVVGTEIGSENHIGCFDYSEGMMSKPMVAREFGWRYKDCAFYGDDVPADFKKIALNPKTRIPLWELVYHDCSVNYYHWMDTNLIYPELCPWRDMFCILYGLPPIYSMKVAVWDKLKDQAGESYRRVSPVARQTTFSRMTDFAYLSSDRMVQRTRFENGVTVTVNFAENVRTLPNGRTIEAGGYLVENFNTLQRKETGK